MYFVSELIAAFNRLMKDKTVLVIAHRLNTIEKADQILVMDGGRIREAGSHGQLMELNGRYAHAIQEQKKAQKWTVGVRDCSYLLTSGHENNIL